MNNESAQTEANLRPAPSPRSGGMTGPTTAHVFNLLLVGSTLLTTTTYFHTTHTFTMVAPITGMVSTPYTTALTAR